MTMHRRPLLQGMLAGGALAAVGLPGAAHAGAASATAAPRARPAVLLRAGGAAARRFEAAVGTALPEAEVVHLPCTPVPDAAAVRRALERGRGARILGLLPDAAWVVVAEIARDHGVRLLLEGRHAALAGATRHALHSAAGFHGAGEHLSAALARAGERFALTEAVLGGGGRALRGCEWERLGFTSYRVGAERAAWLHLAGISAEQACAALGTDPAEAESLRCWRAAPPPEDRAAPSWQEALGAVLARVARGDDRRIAPAVTQAFVRGPHALRAGAVAESFASFVLEA